MILYIVIAIVLLLIFLFWFSGFIFGAPFQSSSTKARKQMLKLSKVRKGQRVADLGSGTGKLVIEFARKGAKVTGFEINPFLVWISRRKIKALGLQKNAKIEQKNFWNTNLSYFDIITVFQIGYVMGRLGKKLEKEVKRKRKKLIVISNTWKFPGRKPEKKEGYVRLYRF